MNCFKLLMIVKLWTIQNMHNNNKFCINNGLDEIENDNDDALRVL